MARPIRVEFAGAVYHILARGNERKAIFRSDKDRKHFLETLRECIEQFGLVLHCYCLMSNHYHLAVETPRANLSKAMAWLQTTYTVRFNRKHRRTGHLFQGRYKAILVEANSYAIELIRYIHLNPVRPRDKNSVLAAENREKLKIFAWSSHRAYAGTQQAPHWLNLDWLSYHGNTRKMAQKEYRRDIDQSFGKAHTELLDQVQRSLVLGGERLLETVEERIGHKNGQQEIRWTEHQTRSQVQKRLAKLERAETDPKMRLWMRVALGGHKRIEVAREFGYKDGSAVTHIIHRLKNRAARDKKLNRKLEELRRNLSSFKL
jgi:putative transposase